MPAQAYAQGMRLPAPQRIRDQSRVQGMLDTPFYIACLRLWGRRYVVVGGGEVGPREGRGPARLRRRGDADRAGGDRAAASSARGARFRWERRPYSGASDPRGRVHGDRGHDDTDVNIAVYDDAERRAMLVNVVDVPPLCNFILPAIVRTESAGDRDLDRGAPRRRSRSASRRRSRTSTASPTRAWRSCQRGPRLGQGHAAGTYQDRKEFSVVDRERRARPGRTAPTGDERGVSDLIAAAQRTTPGLSGRLTMLDEVPGRPGWSTWAPRPVTDRRSAFCRAFACRPQTAAAVARGDAKGDVPRSTARIAGIQVAKRTAELDPALPPAPAFVRGRSDRGRRPPRKC